MKEKNEGVKTLIDMEIRILKKEQPLLGRKFAWRKKKLNAPGCAIPI